MLLRTMLGVLVSTASVELLQRLFMVFREAYAHNLGVEVPYCRHSFITNLLLVYSCLA